ncbi:MAG: hypothetical protein MJK14_00195 [Rivularia sp. ALOHA_DT_140]|nr:hypothetical protein [Rivularia sp. ALOHA_DT_140]
MLYRFAIASGILLTSFTNFIPTVLAEVKFSSMNPGVIEAKGADFKVLESVVPGNINVNVPSGNTAQVTVLSPSFASGPSEDPSGTKKVGFLEFGSNKLSSDGNNNTANLLPGDTNLEVGLRIERPVSFTPGTYNYSVNLSVTIVPE